MSSEKPRDPIQNAIDQCYMTQCVLDNTAKQLVGLRTQCSTAEEITQKEIKEAEVSKTRKLQAQAFFLICACKKMTVAGGNFVKDSIESSSSYSRN